MGKYIKKGTSREYSKWTEEKAMELANELLEWISKDDKRNLFIREFLLQVKDLYPDVLAYLRSKFPSFDKAIEKAKQIQEVKLLKYGVLDSYNATITQFVLVNHFGYKSRHEKEVIREERITGIDIKVIEPGNEKDKD